MTAFLCDLYGNQFEISDVYNGLPYEDILVTAFHCIRSVVQMFDDSVNGGSTPDKNSTVRPIEALNKLYKEIIKQGWTLPYIDESDFLVLMDLLIERERQVSGRIMDLKKKNDLAYKKFQTIWIQLIMIYFSVCFQQCVRYDACQHFSNGNSKPYARCTEDVRKEHQHTENEHKGAQKRDESRQFPV